jgi:thiamine biosynthesis lipoprotein
MPAGWSFVQSRVYMDTIVTIEVPNPDDSTLADVRVERAFGWFAEVERTCNRFDEASALRQLCFTHCRAVRVPPLLLRALDVALEVARLSNGAFDPTVGAAMEDHGFDRDYRSGGRRRSGVLSRAVSFRDVHMDLVSGTITLAQPLLLDLGAVAKGLAIDLAAVELAGLGSFAINAGGDVLVRGCNAEGGPWTIGVKDPRRPQELMAVLAMEDGTVCTSGDYERSNECGHHILDPRTREPSGRLSSATVVAPSAMLADALSTAAFVLGPEAGRRFLEEQCVEGMLIAPDGRISETAGMAAYRR